jgi:sugar/nucleoside kinase (ribokinase family)
MKLLIVGHSVVDHIFDEKSEKTAPGGIFYSSIGFNSLKKKNDELFLLTSFSDDDYKYFEKVFENFNLEYSNKLPVISHVNLYLDGSAERKEHYLKTVEPLKLNPNLNLDDFDGVYINMVTGSDLSSKQFEELRKNYNGKIFIDVHTLSRGMGKDQHRFFRKIPNYEMYLSSVDIIQVNEHELKTITPFDEKEKILKKVFELGVEILLLTKGSKGAEVYTNKGNYFSVDAININSVNKIGCGDVFGSVFFYLYLSGLKIEKALQKANYAAGIVTSFKTEEEFLNLKNDII